MTTTESFSNYHNLEKKTTPELLKIINKEDKTVPLIIEKSLKEISVIIDKIFERMVEGGRLFYIGSGTPGRLGIVDASECPPTFGVDNNVNSKRYKISEVDSCGYESDLSLYHENIHLTANVGINGELNLIWDQGSTINNWNQVRSSFPDMELSLYGPGTDSGTFDYFTDVINGEESDVEFESVFSLISDSSLILLCYCYDSAMIRL